MERACERVRRLSSKEWHLGEKMLRTGTSFQAAVKGTSTTHLGNYTPRSGFTANPAAAWYYLWSDKYTPSVIQLTRGRELNVISRNLTCGLRWVVFR
jgi:hypothetical protein